MQLLSLIGHLVPGVGGWGFRRRLERPWLAVEGPAVLVVMVLPPTSPSLSHPTQVTTYLHKDYNNLWIIKKHNTNSGNAVGNGYSYVIAYSEPSLSFRMLPREWHWDGLS